MIGNAVRVMRIATGEEGEDVPPAPAKDESATAVGREGRKARAEAMARERRAEVAQAAAAGARAVHG